MTLEAKVELRDYSVDPYRGCIEAELYVGLDSRTAKVLKDASCDSSSVKIHEIIVWSDDDMKARITITVPLHELIVSSSVLRPRPWPKSKAMDLLRENTNAMERVHDALEMKLGSGHPKGGSEC